MSTRATASQTVTFAVRVLGLLGVRILILTNAAGGINAAFAPGRADGHRRSRQSDGHATLWSGPTTIASARDFPTCRRCTRTRLRRIAGRRPERRAPAAAAWHLCGCRRAQLRNASRDPILTDDRGRRRRDVDGPRSHRRPAHGHRSARPVVHQQHGRRRVCRSRSITAKSSRRRGASRGAFSALLEGIVGQL